MILEIKHNNLNTFDVDPHQVKFNK